MSLWMIWSWRQTMRLANRIILVIVLLVLVVFGTFGAIYAFAGSSYQAAGLPGFLATPENAQPAQSWLSNFEKGYAPVLDFAIVVVVFVAGLVLLVLELIPGRKHYLQLGRRLWVKREVVEKEAESVALTDQAVLESYAKLSPHRLLQSKLKLQLVVRRGESPEDAKHRVRDLLSTEIVGKGQLDIKRTRIKAEVKDPRVAKRRVK
jgi:hypothetical protein